MVDRIEGPPPITGGQVSVFHVFVVALSLILTLTAWQFARNQVEKRTELRFHAARDQVVALIWDGMHKYEDALWAGVATVESHGGDISYRDWQIFAANLRIDQRYPGINGIGVIHYLTPGAMDDYLARQRAARPGFSVFPDHDQPFFMPITYIEPEATNAAAIGLDVAHETNRRTAALAARDTGTAQITGPIVLVQDAARTPGFLFYVPLYADGAPSDPSDRQSRFLGAVYAPFVVHKLMDGLLAKELRGLRFSIRDADILIYNEHAQPDADHDPDPMFREQVTIDLYGREWVLDIRTSLAFRQDNNLARPNLILFAGLLIEGLIIALLFLMSRANKTAVTYAARVTSELKDERAKLISANAALTSKNAEMERFTYVASHDLKTPVRGIGGLADMIQEDLADYFASSSADPEVAANLDRIHERVGRMNDLIGGIMAMSRVDAHQPGDADAVAISAVISDLRLDFALSPDALRFSGPADAPVRDGVNFRRVLENLVDNAIKYHDGSDPVSIEISAANLDGRLSVTVTDNGPGIDAQYHDRIFDVFQTLRRDGEAESTGIGLSIVRKAVERHGGSVQVTSSHGSGASFRFDWPFATSALAPSPVDRAA